MQMIRHEETKFQEVWYEETMADGLHVILFHKPLFTTTSCLLAAPYGSLDCREETEDGTILNFPSGTAHFLEHKLFESDHGDVMADFSRLGANVNAYTSYEETVYYFTTPDPDIEKPLSLMLDFVQNFAVTEASVQKEKGIIQQERSMYLQDGDSRLFLETMRSMYQYHPLREDIVGTEASIQAMTLADLEQAYRLNYHPSRMNLILVTPCDPEAVMDLIRKNQASRTFSAPVFLKRALQKEPETVFRARSETAMDLSDSRIMKGFRLNPDIADDRLRLETEWALKMKMDAWFSPQHAAYQTWIDEKKITPYFSYDSEISRDQAMILFSDEGLDPDAFSDFITKQLEDCLQAELPEESLSEMKKRTLGAFLHLFDSPLDLAISVLHGEMNRVSLFEEFRLVETMTPERCQALTQKIDLSRSVLTILKPMRR